MIHEKVKLKLPNGKEVDAIAPVILSASRETVKEKIKYDYEFYIHECEKLRNFSIIESVLLASKKRRLFIFSKSAYVSHC